VAGVSPRPKAGCRQVRLEHVPVDAEVGLDADRQFALAVALGEAPPGFRIWRSRTALVVGVEDVRRPGFAAAAAHLASEGIPCIPRDSGGGAVPVGPGTLMVSLAIPGDPGTGQTLESIYRMLSAPLLALLADLGIAAGFGAVPGAFCDGRFNLVSGGRKLGGTAQSWRLAGGSGRRYVLAEAALRVAGDGGRDTALVSRFYSLAGAPRSFDPAAVTSLAELCGHNALSPAVVATRLAVVARRPLEVPRGQAGELTGIAAKHSLRGMPG